LQYLILYYYYIINQNFFLGQVAGYLFYLVTLQSWVFAMKYLDSAIICTF
jgi:hypothetical protein